MPAKSLCVVVLCVLPCLLAASCGGSTTYKYSDLVDQVESMPLPQGAEAGPVGGRQVCEDPASQSGPFAIRTFRSGRSWNEVVRFYRDYAQQINAKVLGDDTRSIYFDVEGDSGQVIRMFVTKQDDGSTELEAFHPSDCRL